MFVIILHYMQPASVVAAHLEAHRAYLDERYAASEFIASGPQEPRIGGVMLDEILAADPFYVHQVAQYGVIEFNATKFAPGAQEVLMVESNR